MRIIDQRYYASSYGRFNTADPYRASGGPASPASWNRYAYTRGDPINRIDRRGLEDTDPIEQGPDDPSGGDGGGGEGPPPEPDPCNDAESEAGCPGAPAPPPAPQPPPPPQACVNWGCMPAAEAQALIDLDRPGCGNTVFAGGIAKGDNPVTVLESLVSGSQPGALASSPYGSINFNPISPSFEAITISGGGNIFRRQRKATIDINPYNNPSIGIYWNAGNADVNAITLIHELGHLFNFVFGAGSSTIQYDGGGRTGVNMTAEANNAARLLPCTN